MIPIDLHTHSIASGHGTTHTITNLAKAASQKGMNVLGISDHGPATPGSCKESYFRSLKTAPRNREGIQLLYGIEANILTPEGNLDISDTILADLDYVIASLHIQSFSPMEVTTDVKFSYSATSTPVTDTSTSILYNTNAYINAMANPYVRILGHPDDTHFPVDTISLIQAAADYHVILEVNEASLIPEGYRGDTRANLYALLRQCLNYRLPILLSSDSHGALGIGVTYYSERFLKELNYPKELILNYQPIETFLNYRT